MNISIYEYTYIIYYLPNAAYTGMPFTYRTLAVQPILPLLDHPCPYPTYSLPIKRIAVPFY